MVRDRREFLPSITTTTTTEEQIKKELDRQKRERAFIEKATKKHKGKYDYSKVEYVNNHTKVIIICPEHGEFKQEPRAHLEGQGCPECGRIQPWLKTRKPQSEFIEEATILHKGRYDYSKVEYVKSKKEVCIICPTHGEFWQTPSNHLHGYGCPVCAESQLEKQIRVLLENKNIQFFD